MRLKPRAPSAGGQPPPPEPPPPSGLPPPPPPGAVPDAGDAAGRLRLKPRLNLAEDPVVQAAPPAPPPEYSDPIPPPPEPAPPEPAPQGVSEVDSMPKFKLRPKNAPAPPPPSPSHDTSLPPPPDFMPPPPGLPPPPPPSMASPVSPGDLPPPPPPGRSHGTLPPVSVLAAPPPVGGAMEAPPPPGAIPRLSLGTTSEAKAAPTAKGGLNIRVADSLGKPGGKPGVKPPVVKPGKPGSVLRKRPALSPVMKAGIGVLVLGMAVGGFFFYRVFFPAPSPVVKIKSPPIAKARPDEAKKSAADVIDKVTSAPGKLIDSGQNAILARRAAEQAKMDAIANGQEPPTPTPSPDVAQAVMAQTSLSNDVKVNNTPIVAAPTASAAFRAFVGNASIGGVFQGTPSKALINNRIVREGQTVDSELGIVFDRIDVVKKNIYFKDATGAEVSKNY